MDSNQVHQFCTKTGDDHSKYPPSYAYCPICSLRIQRLAAIVPRDTTPVRKQSHIIDLLDDTPPPPPPPPKAIFIPKAAAPIRGVAESNRQQSIVRTSQLTIRPPAHKYMIALTVALVQNILVKVHDTFSRPKFSEWAPIHHTQFQLANISFENYDEFIRKYILTELVRVNLANLSTDSPYLAIDIGKQGVIHLSSSSQDYRTVKDLLDCGIFKKDSSGAIKVFLVYENTQLPDSYDEEDILADSSPIKPIKREKIAKVTKKKAVIIKPELPQTSTPTYERKRAISQLSDTQESRTPDLISPFTAQELDNSLAKAPYSLRSLIREKK